MSCWASMAAIPRRSSSSRRTWIEILPDEDDQQSAWSSSSRRTWIEIALAGCQRLAVRVVLLAEDVDRNDCWAVNRVLVVASSSLRRTWIDIARAGMREPGTRSSSLRRTWIEMPIAFRHSTSTTEVVLLAEDVDRNVYPPAIIGAFLVVLLAEDVDRNTFARLYLLLEVRRPPCGGRG